MSSLINLFNKNITSVKSSKLYFLSISTGILLGICWNNILPAISLFVAFVPLLFVIQQPKLHYSQIFHYSFISFFLFHLGVAWWLFRSSIFGGLSIMLINSTAQSLVMLLVHKIRQKSNEQITLMAFVVFWLSFEYLHFHWELSIPTMNLGNWLGQVTQIIQWYEYTGILGGSLWILISNVIVYQIIISYRNGQRIKANILIFGEIILILFPILVSKNIEDKSNFNGYKINFTVIQPNINPYSEKYKSSLFKKQTERQIQLAQTADTLRPTCIVYPESSFPKYLDETKINNDKFIQTLNNKLITNENRAVIASCYTYKAYDNDTIFYNTAFMLKANYPPQIYHKSKLVLGVEKIPFDSYFRFLKKLNLDFGGYTNSLGIDNERNIFRSFSDSLKIAPVICYESIYGEFITQYVKKGANCIAIMTNDAWWGNTSGYKQHLMHAQLRAIENRKAVVRAANTGTSCFINAKGKISAQANDWQEAVLTSCISTNNYISFYTKHGDYIGRFAICISLILLIAAVVKLLNFTANK